jgi:hypothetical protein
MQMTYDTRVRPGVPIDCREESPMRVCVTFTKDVLARLILMQCVLVAPQNRANENGVEALVPSRGRWSSETMDASTEAVV